MYIEGNVKIDSRTKDLIHRLDNKDIAVIKHKDIDEIAAIGLSNKRPQAVVNFSDSISGRYPNVGPEILMNENMVLVDVEDKSGFDRINEGDSIVLDNGKLYVNGEFLSNYTEFTKKLVEELIDESKKNLEVVLEAFLDNTIDYAKREKGMILGGLHIPYTETNFNGRHVLIVIRGKDYKEDLLIISNYIREMNPVLIGVDGGGDALLDLGYVPDIVIGDMDSVSENCLKQCKEIIVHAYPNGKAPGVEIVEKLGLDYKLFPAPGTSEDIAMLLAYEKNAELIVAVGAHTNMIDFLEKGRKGMASTFLVRLKIGSKLIDAKGVNKLYKEKFKLSHIGMIILAAIIPISIALMFSPISKHLIRLIELRLKILFK